MKYPHLPMPDTLSAFDRWASAAASLLEKQPKNAE